MSGQNATQVNGEVVIHLARLHWITPAVPGAVLAVPYAALLAAPFGDSPTVLACELAATALAGAWLLGAYLAKALVSVAVTNKRLVLRFGLIRRRSTDLPFAKIESVDVEQDRIGARLNYGSLVIHPCEGPPRTLRRLAAPWDLQKKIQERLDAEKKEERRLFKREKFLSLSGELEFWRNLCPVRVLNLGLGGAFLEGPDLEWPELGHALALRLTLDGKRLSLLARLMRHEDKGCAAVAFEAMESACESDLAQFMLEQERKRIIGRSNPKPDRRVTLRLAGEMHFGRSLRPVEVLDLGVGGAKVEGRGFEWPDPDTSLTLSLVLDGQKVGLPGRLARLEDGGGAQVAFETEALDGGGEIILERFLHAQERERLKEHLNESEEGAAGGA